MPTGPRISALLAARVREQMIDETRELHKRIGEARLAGRRQIRGGPVRSFATTKTQAALHQNRARA
jgi:hypothetical protein